MIVVLAGSDAIGAERVEAIADHVDVPIVSVMERAETLGARFVLFFDDAGRLALRDLGEPKAGPISVRFDDVPIRQGKVQVSRNEPLGRAFGGDVETIVDATAGLGHDAFLLACMGYRVVAIERNPVIAALLRDGVERATNNGRIRNAIEDRLTIVEADSIAALAAMGRQGSSAPDAVYLDPMFPQKKRRKSALAKVSIRAVRAVVGDDPDSFSLFSTAVSAARRRIVVKRSDDAPPLAPGAVGSIMGKMVRYDLYAPQAAGTAGIDLPT